MASFLSFPSPFVSHPIARTLNFSTNNPESPPPPPPQQPPSSPAPPPPSQQLNSTVQGKPQEVPKRRPIGTKVESTDWISTSLSRRFGIGAGLAWVGFLAFGVISEQVKTRFEVSQQEANTRNVEKEQEVVLPNGIRYYEMKVGGGVTPRPGDLVVIDLKGKVEGSSKVFVNTFDGEKKPLALVMGSRPYSKGVCEGIEYVLRSMKAGGRRRVIVPSNLGFGDKGADLGEGLQIPPNAELEYIIEVDKVSIAPA